MKQSLLLALGIIVLTNIWILSGVAYNRGAPPVAEITLTERELTLPYWALSGNRESSSLVLNLRWSSYQDDALEYYYGRSLAVTAEEYRALNLDLSHCDSAQRRCSTACHPAYTRAALRTLDKNHIAL